MKSNPATSPQVSVIVLSYNHENTIARCLESIVTQKVDFRYEVIVADDASTDNSASIIQTYADHYPEIIKPVLRKKNVGAEINCSEAYAMAKAPYMAACEGDDYWCNTNKLQTAVNVLDNNPDCIMFVHNTEVIDQKNNVKSQMIENGWQMTLADNKFSYKNNKYTHFSARVFRNTTFPNYYDTFMYHMLLTKGNAYYHDEIMSVYNYDGKGAWSQLDIDKQIDEKKEILEQLNALIDFKYDAYYTTCYDQQNAIEKKKLLDLDIE